MRQSSLLLRRMVEREIGAKRNQKRFSPRMGGDDRQARRLRCGNERKRAGGNHSVIILIAGASHTGKTKLAQSLLEKYKFPYLSIDHLKMGLIRSGHTELTPESNDEELTAYLWPIICEIIKTAIENKQNLIVEGCYIPCDWQRNFGNRYLSEIKSIFLVMTERYIRSHFDSIKKYANIIENRVEDDCTPQLLIADNQKVLEQCKANRQKVFLIDREYKVEAEL